MSAEDTLLDERLTAQLVEKLEAERHHIRSEFVAITLVGGVRKYEYPSDDIVDEVIRLRKIESAAALAVSQKKINAYRRNVLEVALGVAQPIFSDMPAFLGLGR